MSETPRSLPSQTERVVVYGRGKTTNTALCADDKCPWKHRGVTAAATLAAAEKHVREVGHEVLLYVEKRMTVRPA